MRKSIKNVKGNTLKDLLVKVEKEKKNGFKTLNTGGVMKQGNKYVITMIKGGIIEC